MTTELQEKLLGLLKGEFSHLSIEFNSHACNYFDVAEAIETGYYDYTDWVSEVEKKLASEMNKVWVIQWYPNTPVGFHAIAASTLEACIAAIGN